jgi:hypothetical protein
MLVNVTDATAYLGYSSRSTLSRLLRAGLLVDYERPGGKSRERLLETHPEGRPTLREYVQSLTQIRYDSPLWKRDQRRPEPSSLQQLSDEELHAYTAEVLSDEALEAAMAPINAWCDSQATPDWSRVAEYLNPYLGDAWSPPPYTGDQVATLAMALSLAEEAAADG